MVPKITVRTVPINEQRVTTLGDWWENVDGSFEFRLTEMGDPRHVLIVLIHELTEWVICQSLGVRSSDADAFDFLWEEEIRQGLHSPLEEAGFDRRCPYRAGHIWGARMERLFCWILGVRWRDYLRACDQKIAEYVQR